MNWLRFVFALSLLTCTWAPSWAKDDFYLKHGDRVTFLGDSNTFAGGFITYLDAYIATRFPDRKIELINLGLPSETITGLSEEDHPYPRPSVQSRIDRALSETKPTVVVIAYGMNDGIYAPFDPKRFTQYQSSIKSSIAKVKAIGARIVLMTPDPFDPISIKDRTQPVTGMRFSYLKPYHDYDQVLAAYAKWLVTLRSDEIIVADPHSAITAFLAEIRKKDPSYVISKDGIHPDATGHWLVARELLKVWHAPTALDSFEIPAADWKMDPDGGLGEPITCKMPLPEDLAWDPRLKTSSAKWADWNQSMLKVKGLAAPAYDLLEGDTVLIRASAKAYSDGIDLSKLPTLVTNRQSRTVLQWAQERQAILSRAWLTHVGHKRPDTPVGIPLEEAKKKAIGLTEKLIEAAKPRKLNLKLIPVKETMGNLWYLDNRLRKWEAFTIQADVCIYGGTPAGVMAAVQAGRSGKTVILAVLGTHVGGMTSGGLTATDVGDVRTIGGLVREFYDRIGKLRGFPPSQAETTFRDMLKGANVRIVEQFPLLSIESESDRIQAIFSRGGSNIRAKMFIDASYEGDLMAMAGVTYTVGRESNDRYRETINGVQFKQYHNFLFPVDPFRIIGDPKSGLLPEISRDPPALVGSADRAVQAYNFRMFLTTASDRLPFPKPANYDRNRYALLERYLKHKPDHPWEFAGQNGPLQLQMGDSNNSGAFSTDYIGGSWAWPEGSLETRERLFQDHVAYQQGLLYFLAYDEQLPEHWRAKVTKWGLDSREFRETGGWPHELYVREGRRMVSTFVMTQHVCESKQAVTDSVGLGSYAMDSHNTQRLVIDGHARNEGDVQVKVPKPYPISYRAIVPREGECLNLLVPVCLSSTHIAYGSIRMEPVFMGLGQSAGTAAVIALDDGINVQRVPYTKLRERLLADRHALEWTPMAKPMLKK